MVVMNSFLKPEINTSENYYSMPFVACGGSRTPDYCASKRPPAGGP